MRVQDSGGETALLHCQLYFTRHIPRADSHRIRCSSAETPHTLGCILDACRLEALRDACPPTSCEHTPTSSVLLAQESHTHLAASLMRAGLTPLMMHTASSTSLTPAGGLFMPLTSVMSFLLSVSSAFSAASSIGIAWRCGGREKALKVDVHMPGCVSRGALHALDLGDVVFARTFSTACSNGVVAWRWGERRVFYHPVSSLPSLYPRGQ